MTDLEYWIYVWFDYVLCSYDSEYLPSKLLLHLFPNRIASSFVLCYNGVWLLQQILQVMNRYNKSLQLSSKSRARYNQGEIMNLMEVDSQKFQDITSYNSILSFSHLVDIFKQSGQDPSKSSVPSFSFGENWEWPPWREW